MTAGVKTIIFPVTDRVAATALYSVLLGCAPYIDGPYYVGFRVADQEVGLDPHGQKTGPVAFWHVDDIAERLTHLVAAGATIQQEVKDVGGGRLIASVTDADGNKIGLLQDPS